MGVVLRVHCLQNQIESSYFTAWSRQGVGATVKNAVAHVEAEERGGGGKQRLVSPVVANL